jgi:CRISPR type III-A-associated protein Csm2
MCRNYQFKIDYFEGQHIKKDLFSDEAERIVKCFLNKFTEKDKDRRGKIKKKLSYSQIRKFYDEVLNLKAQLELDKEKDETEKFRKILPYFRMLKAKASIAYSRDVINTNFKTFIEENVDYVKEDEKKFEIFCTFFEAVVAYSKGIFE